MSQHVHINCEGRFLVDCEAAAAPDVVRVGDISDYEQLDELLNQPVVRWAIDSFADGRALSLTRQLRLRGYQGSVALVGDIVPDQLPMAIAAGIDVIEISEAHAARCDEAQWRAQVSVSRFGYQNSLGRRAYMREL